MMEEAIKTQDDSKTPNVGGVKTLTQRLVELSERKMKLIKHLLSPEEYSSIALNLFSAESTDVSDAETLLTSICPSTRVVVDDNLDYSLPSAVVEPSYRSLSDSLAKKREANEFFFAFDDDDEKLRKQEDISIELRSGYNINYQSNDVKPLLTDGQFSFFGHCATSLRSQATDDKVSRKSLESRSITCPYSTKRNLEIMKKRLRAENALDKLLLYQSQELKSQRQYFPFNSSKQLVNFYESVQSMKSTNLAWKDFRLVKNISRQRCKSPPDPSRASLEIEFISLTLIEHPSFNDEERLAAKLAICGRELELLGKIRPKLANRLIAKAQSASKKHFPSKLDMQSKLLIVINQFIQINEKMRSMQQELLNTYQELTAIRENQQSVATTIFVEQVEDDMKSFVDFGSSVEELIEKLDASEGLKESLSTCVLMMKQTNQKYLIRFSVKGNVNQDEAQKRRIEVSNWIESLQVSLDMDSESNHCFSLEANSDNLFILTITKNPVLFKSLPSGNSELRVKLLADRKSILPFMRRTEFVSEVIVHVKPNCNMRHSMDLQCLEGSAIIQLVIDTRHVVGTDEDCREKLVKLLHNDLFPCHSTLVQYPKKVYQLMNYVDLNFLSKVLGLESSNLSGYCTLNLEENFKEENTESTRYSLLKWRWINNLKQIVYLGNQENLLTYGKQAQEFRAKLMSINSKKYDEGYNNIELARNQALVYIRKLEKRLLNRVKVRTEQVKQDQDVEIPSGDKFLEHPSLSVDLSGLVRIASSLMPRPTARRPLGAQKASNRWASLKSSFLHPSNTQQTSGQIGRPQLVVSLQSASNVPMRVVQRVQAIHSRSLTPVGAMPGSVPTPISISSNEFPLISGTHLEPATSYVELVFQRYQVASSLARGKHPAWNETLFLPIQIPQDTLMTAESSLVDELLQISLWDYCCHQENVGTSDGSLRLDETLLSPSRMPPRVSTTNQRVERHLLGCLKIPLSALISTGKIEGTFAMEQDCMLDSYSFVPETAFNIPIGMEAGERLNASSPVANNSNHLQTTYIRLFITLDPPIAIGRTHHLEINFRSSDSEHLLQYAQLWSKTLSERPIRNTGRGVLRDANPHQSAGVKTGINNLHVRTLALLSSGKYIIISRLLQSLDPPPTLLDDIPETQAKMFALARFVSLLSPLKYGIFQHSARALATTLWFDSWQLIVKCLGGPEEKATLLCNYFLGLGKYSGLLLADSVQEGRCVYVIVWEDFSTKPSLESELQLQAAELFKSISGISSPTSVMDNSINSPALVQVWNPTNATNYTSLASSPLLSVGAIVTTDNIYANLQNSPGMVVAETNFNIHSKQHWFPLFDIEPTTNSAQSTLNLNFGISKVLGTGKSVSWTRRCQTLEHMRRMLGPISLSPVMKSVKINYEARMSNQECQQLGETIEHEVKAHLLKWRPQRPTNFNTTLSQSIQSWLAKFEELSCQGKQTQAGWHLELARFIKSEPLSGFNLTLGNQLSGRKLISCPINIPYTSMKVILDTVFASGVANADLVLKLGANSPETQFMVACHVKSYPARVVSVWLYTAAILTV